MKIRSFNAIELPLRPPQPVIELIDCDRAALYGFAPRVEGSIHRGHCVIVVLRVARLHLGKLGARLTELSKDQAEYIGVNVEGPYKPDHYRY